MTAVEPFASRLDFGTGVLGPSNLVLRRKLSEMGHVYADEAARRKLIEEAGDALVYEVYVVELPETEGHLPHCATVIYPGRVGHEYFMTKGHFHAKRDRAEIYLGIAGEGYLLLQRDDEVRGLAMSPGTVAYVPPYWAHRTANIGEKPFAFFAAWPGDAGHDYETIEAKGFAKILVQQEGIPVLVDTPAHR